MGVIDKPKIIKDGDLAKVQEVFPGKFIFIYVADHQSQSADMAGSAKNAADIKLFRTLLFRVTLGDNGQPKGNN
jgi:hypothetical protein